LGFAAVAAAIVQQQQNIGLAGRWIDKNSTTTTCLANVVLEMLAVV
jgi:hypothetical protein